MTLKLIDGKAIAAQICQDVTVAIQSARHSGKRPPRLVAVLVGNDAPSQLYVKRKQEACQRVGITTDVIALAPSIDDHELWRTLEGLNQDDSVDGILLQLPLPDHLDTKAAISRIAVEKDVDGLSPHHQGCLQWRFPATYPCTAIAVLHILKSVLPDLSGKLVAIVGLSPLAGAPISALLSQERATTINLHRGTENPAELCRQAQIIVSCTGVKSLIQSDWMREGVILIDVGIYREGKKIFGDMEFEAAQAKAAYLTPVPGGVGPVTIAMLTKNTLSLYEKNTSSHAESN